MRKTYGRGTRASGGILVLVLATLIVVSVLSWSAVQNFVTSSMLTRLVDQRRQQQTEDSVICELLREAMYDTVGGESSSILSNKIHEYLTEYVRGSIEVEVVGDMQPRMLGPIVWSEDIVWPVSAIDRESLPASIRRWTGVNRELYRGDTLSIRVTAAREYRYLATPIYIPVSCMPFIVYDLVWDGVNKESVAHRSAFYRIPERWKTLRGHDWMRQTPSRLRDLLQVRMGTYRQWFDPDHEREWIRMFEERSTVLNFNEPATLDRLLELPGVEMEGDAVRVNMSLFEEEALLILGKGKVIFEGQRAMNPLLVLARPVDKGSIQVIASGAPGSSVGPLVLYGMTSWRSDGIGSLYITSDDGTAIAGACILSPEIIPVATVLGHVSMNTPDSMYMNQDYEIPVLPGVDEEMNQVGRCVPLMTMWHVIRESSD